VSELTDIQKDLLKTEYDALWALMSKNIDLIEKNERYAVAACGAAIAFILSKNFISIGENVDTVKQIDTVKQVAAWVVFIIPCLGWVRYFGLRRANDTIYRYFREKIESNYAAVGYHTFYKEIYLNGIHPKGAVGWSRHLYWAALSFAALNFPLLINNFQVCHITCANAIYAWILAVLYSSGKLE